MSDTGENRWRTSRGATHNQNQIQNQNRQPAPQQRQAPPREKSSRSQIPTPHGGEGPGLVAMSGNAWPGDRTNRDGGSQGPAQEQHIPVRGFNAKEIREELLGGYNSASTRDSKSGVYSAAGKDINNAKPGGPWASKPNTMANGKDFFLELRKQVSLLQANPGTPSA